MLTSGKETKKQIKRNTEQIKRTKKENIINISCSHFRNNNNRNILTSLELNYSLQNVIQ